MEVKVIGLKHSETCIYIAGKITGEPINDCIRKFHRAEVYLKNKYMTVDQYKKIGTVQYVLMIETVNPLEIKGIHFGIEHEKAMELCFTELAKCSHAYFIEDWQKSKGALMEREYCLKHGITIID